MGAALVNSCYNYSKLRSSHLLRSYKRVNLMTGSRQSCCYNLLSALLVPYLFPVLSLKLEGSALDSLSPVKKTACRKAHPKNIVSNKGNHAYSNVPLYKQENSNLLWK